MIRILFTRFAIEVPWLPRFLLHLILKLVVTSITVIFASSDYLLTSMGGIFSKKATLIKQFEVFGLKFMFKTP